MPAEGRLVLIVNPTASAVRSRARVAVRRAFEAFDVEELETTARDDAIALARTAAETGARAVVVLGGDGTANEAANGVMGSATALAALPGGSTNVFARTVGLSRHADEAAAQVATALAGNSVRELPVGSANGRTFLFHVGLGFDAAVVEQVERRAGLKRKVGQAIFVYAAVATWLGHYDRKSPQFTLELEDGSVVENGYFSICLNTNPYTFLGPRPLNVAPGVTGEHGLTAVTLQSLKLRPLLGVMTRALGSGQKVARHRAVDVRSDLARLTVRGKQPFPWQTDGDFMGRTERLAISQDPRRLTVVVPAAEQDGGAPPSPD